ncbi:MAG: PIG-L family deacetylase [Micrococcales bacterium]|nr:PIG-L family deacetylase [Micrococcales bacterium]
MNEHQRALVLMAHPDDIDFWGVGTVMGWVKQSWLVTYVLVTDGQAGGGAGIGQVRRQEQLAAAELAGVSDVRFLEGFQDGQITANPPLIRAICRVIRQVRPQRVLTQSPTRNWNDIRLTHPDHLAVGEAVAQAVYPFARNPHAFPELAMVEGLEPWIVEELWLLGDPAPNKMVDITDTYPAREQAMMAHVSQLPDREKAGQQLHQMLTECGQAAGLPAGHLAEAFRVVPITY